MDLGFKLKGVRLLEFRVRIQGGWGLDSDLVCKLLEGFRVDVLMSNKLHGHRKL